MLSLHFKVAFYGRTLVAWVVLNKLTGTVNAFHPPRFAETVWCGRGVHGIATRYRANEGSGDEK